MSKHLPHHWQQKFIFAKSNKSVVTTGILFLGLTVFIKDIPMLLKEEIHFL